MPKKLTMGRFDVAGFSSMAAYAICSLSIPLSLVAMGKSLHFPLDQGGMGAGGVLHFIRSFSMVAALLCCGMVAGRIGKRRSMGLAMSLIGCGVFCCALSPDYALLFPCLLLAGFGEGICEGIATPFVQDLHQDAPERYVNIAHGMWSVGIAVSVFLSGALLSAGISWRFVLGGAALTALASAVLFLLPQDPARPYPESGAKEDPGTILRYSLQIAKTPRFWVYSLGMFLGAGPEFCLTFWSAAYLELSFGASAWTAGLGTGAIAAGMFLGRLSFGYFAKKEYLKHILLFSALGTIPLTLLLVWIEPDFFPSKEAFFCTMFLLLFLCGIGISPYWPTLQVHGVTCLPQLDATMLYIYFSAIGTPGCGIFTWLMGHLGDQFGLKRAFLLLPGGLLLFALLIFAEGWLFPVRRGTRNPSENGKKA